MLEKSRIEWAIQVLVKAGILVPFDESLELYHGRVGTPGEEWTVDPHYRNGGNATGNRNVNQVSALNTSDRATAERFAEARASIARRTGANPEGEADVERIMPLGRAYIIAAPSTIRQSEVEAVRVALETLTRTGNINVAPIPFETRLYGRFVMLALLDEAKGDETFEQHGIITFEIVDRVAEKLTTQESLDEHFAKIGGVKDKKAYVKQLIGYIASATNARAMFRKDPYKTADVIVTRESELNDTYRVESLKLKSGKKYPFSREYIASVLAAFDIVGIKIPVMSATLDFDTIDNYMLFDTKRVNTARVIGDRQRALLSEFEALGIIADKFLGDGSPAASVLREGSIKEVMEFFKTDEYFGEDLSLPDGNWEGFTVAQHTESVMRWYETNYRGYLPTQLEPFMRVVILGHDLGKGIANRDGRPQSEGNAIEARKLFTSLGLSEQLTQTMLFIIGDGQKYTTDYFIYRNAAAKQEMRKPAREVLKKLLGREPTEEEIDGLWELCVVLQNCDSGAYTRRGVTRLEHGGYHSNGNDRFGRSFSSPDGLYDGGRLIEPPENAD